MKLSKVSLFVFLALLVAVCLPAVSQAQIRLNIPFNFSVAGKSLPAGHYQVTKVFDGNSSAWRIAGDHGSMVMITNSVESPRTSHRPGVVFLKTAGDYSLVR